MTAATSLRTLASRSSPPLPIGVAEPMLVPGRHAEQVGRGAMKAPAEPARAPEGPTQTVTGTRETRPSRPRSRASTRPGRRACRPGSRRRPPRRPRRRRCAARRRRADTGSIAAVELDHPHRRGLRVPAAAGRPRASAAATATRRPPAGVAQDGRHRDPPTIPRGPRPRRAGDGLRSRRSCPTHPVSRPRRTSFRTVPPFLFVDEILELVPGESARARWRVDPDAAFFAGHFPGNPILPGVIIIEALAQTGALAALAEPDTAGKLALFAGIGRARFRRVVRPGEELVLETRLTRRRGPLGRRGRRRAWTASPWRWATARETVADVRACVDPDGGPAVIVAMFPGQGAQAVGMGQALASRLRRRPPHLRGGRRRPRLRALGDLLRRARRAPHRRPTCASRPSSRPRSRPSGWRQEAGLRAGPRDRPLAGRVLGAGRRRRDGLRRRRCGSSPSAAPRCATAGRRRPGRRWPPCSGPSDDEARALAEEAGEVWPANYNCPGQVVVSGTDAGDRPRCWRSPASAASASARLAVDGAVPLAARSPRRPSACGRRSRRGSPPPPTRPSSRRPPARSSRPSACARCCSTSSPRRCASATRVPAAIDTGRRRASSSSGPGRVLSGLVRRVRRDLPVAQVGEPAISRPRGAIAAPGAADAGRARHRREPRHRRRVRPRPGRGRLRRRASATPSDADGRRGDRGGGGGARPPRRRSHAADVADEAQAAALVEARRGGARAARRRSC